VSDVPASARSDTRLGAWLGFVLLFIVLQYGASGDSSLPEDVLYRWRTFVYGCVQVAIMLAIVVAIAWNGPVRELLGLRAPIAWGRAARSAVGVLVVVVVIAAGLEPFLEAGEEQGLVPERWDPSRAAPFAANFALAAALFPIAEELFFRGAGFALLTRFGRVTAIVAVGVLFGLAHGLLKGLPILVAFGVALAWLRHRTASVYPCIAVHATFNAAALIASVSDVEGG
jgi:membrane protease YdiL (CAAX protease family)